jgi:hypothetical protein
MFSENNWLVKAFDTKGFLLKIMERMDNLEIFSFVGYIIHERPVY